MKGRRVKQVFPGVDPVERGGHKERGDEGNVVDVSCLSMETE
jgi:hypothetical protein